MNPHDSCEVSSVFVITRTLFFLYSSPAPDRKSLCHSATAVEYLNRFSVRRISEIINFEIYVICILQKKTLRSLMISMQVLRLISSYLGLGNSVEGCLNFAWWRWSILSVFLCFAKPWPKIREMLNSCFK